MARPTSFSVVDAQDRSTQTKTINTGGVLSGGEPTGDEYGQHISSIMEEIMDLGNDKTRGWC